MTTKTTKATTKTSATVPPPHPASTAYQISDKKWSKPVMKLGFCIIPSVLLQAQQRLGLNPAQLVVLLQLIEFWWREDNKPFPSKQTLSARIGLGPRQIQRHIADLEQAGLVKRIERRAVHHGKLSNEYDLSGLVERLKKIAPDMQAAKDMKIQATLPGGLAKQKKVGE
jgi:DNA-binding transcriptional ArsR family regulator